MRLLFSLEKKGYNLVRNLMYIIQTARQLFLDVCKQFAIVATIVIISLLILADASSIDAQSTSPLDITPDVSPQPTAGASLRPTTPSVSVPSTSIENTIREVERTYGGQLEEYRQLYRQYSVAKQEFANLGTLSSLDTAVQSTQRVMLMRDRVLMTYLELLQLDLQSTQGVELEIKQQTDSLLDQTIQRIDRHYEATENSVDRFQLAERSAEYEEIEELYQYVTALTKEVVTVGELRGDYDQAVAIFDDLPDQLPEASQLKQNQRQRSFTEIQVSLDQVNSLLTESELNLKERLADGRSRRRTSIDQTYVLLLQVANFLEEVYETQ